MCTEEFSSVIAAKKGLPSYKTPYNNDFLNQLIPFIPHLKEAKFYGGEPFMIKIYYEIWDLIIKMNPKCRISIQTNASVMNDRILKLMNYKNIHLNISIDSLKSDVYESIRLGANFNDTMKNIDFFYNYAKKNNTFFGISACMMSLTAEEAPDFIHYCNQLDIPVYFHTVFQPESLALNAIPLDKLHQLIHQLSLNHHFLASTPNQKKNIKHFQDFIRQLQFWANNSNIELNHKHLQPVLNLEDFFIRIEKACVEVFGEEKGRKKSNSFKLIILELKEEGFEYEINQRLTNVLHEDLTSSIFKIIDLNKDKIRNILLENI
jgi:sulfatase maturation enzyme AslB (radical SAM superfamily)